MRLGVYLFVVALLLGTSSADDEECGKDVGGRLCPNNLCCSEYGYCGSTPDYCNDGCQSQCNNISSVIPESTYNYLFPRQNSDECTSKGFYSYQAFIEAALSFPRFAPVDDDQARRREIAAFLAHTSDRTQGEHRYNDFMWGFCILQEINPPSNYCTNPNYGCPGEYYGRGPLQLRGNDNYLKCGDAIGVDLLNNPDLLVSDPVISFKSAFWYWMTAQNSKPSCHSAITGEWQPTPSDEAKGWYPGFGLTMNILNGANDCGPGPTANIGGGSIPYYNKYTGYLQTTTGDHVDCYDQVPMGSQSELLAKTI